MKYTVRTAAIAGAVALAACGGGGGTAPVATPVTIVTSSPSPSPSPTAGPALHTVATWRGVVHSTGGPAGEPLEIGVPTSVTAPAGAASLTLQAYAADASNNPVATAGSVTVTVANGALATAQPVAAVQTVPGPTDVATLTATGSVPGTTSVTVTAPGAAAVTLPLDVYASLGVESTPSRDAAFAWSLQNGTLVPVPTTTADVFVGTARTSATTFFFPYGYQRFPASTPMASIANALGFTPAGTSFTASDLVANPAAYGVIVFKTAGGEYVKARVVVTACLGADKVLCDGGAVLDTIALPSTGGIFPY